MLVIASSVSKKREQKVGAKTQVRDTEHSVTGAKRGVEPAARSNINNIKVISIHMYQTYDCSSNIADKVNNPSTLCA